MNKKLNRALKLLKEIDKLKPLYKELDLLTEELRKGKFKSNGKIRLVDNFKSTNTVYRTTSVKRYTLECL